MSKTQQTLDLLWAEGWAIFELGHDMVEIQCNDKHIFASDAEAVAFVTRKANEGSVPHQEALARHLIGVEPPTKS